MSSSDFKAKNAIAARTYRSNNILFQNDLYMNHEFPRLFIITTVNVLPNIDSDIIPISAHKNLLDLSVPENVTKLLNSCHSMVSQDTIDDMVHRLSIKRIKDGYYNRCILQHQLNASLPFLDSDYSTSKKIKIRNRIKKFRYFHRQNLYYLTMNIHYMILLLELLGYSHIKLKS